MLAVELAQLFPQHIMGVVLQVDKEAGFLISCSEGSRAGGAGLTGATRLDIFTGFKDERLDIVYLSTVV